MSRITLGIGLMVALATPNLAVAEGTAKKVCLIANSQGTVIQQIDAPDISAAGTFCVEQIQKLSASDPEATSVILGCFTQGIQDWTDGLHDIRSPPCQRLR
jgi:hypothetical protein